MTLMELVERGRMFRSAGDPSTAARTFTEAVALAPDDRALLTELALSHLQSAALHKAETVAARLVALDPSDPYARVLLARSLSRQSRHAEAIPHLRLAHAMTADTDTESLLKTAQSRTAP